MKSSARRAAPATGADGGGKPSPSGKESTGKMVATNAADEEDEEEALGALIYKYSRAAKARAEADTDKKRGVGEMGKEPRSPDKKMQPARKKQRKTKSTPATAAIAVGDVGYKFRKRFDGVWYEGRVVKIRPGARE